MQPVVAWVLSACALIVAVWSAYRVPFVNRPIRWLFRTLIADPLHRSTTNAVKEVIADVLHKPNGGHSLYDLGESMKVLRHDMSHVKVRLDELEKKEVA